MGLQRSEQDARILRAFKNVSDDTIVSYQSLKKILGALVRNLPIQGEGMLFKWIPEGCIIGLDPVVDGGDDDFPFNIIPTSGEDGISITVSPGTVNGIVPTIGDDDTPLSTLPRPTLPVNPGDQIWLECDCTAEINGDFVENVAINTAEIGNGPDVPDDELSGETMTIYRVLGFIADDGSSWNYIRYSLEMQACDDNTGTSTAIAVFGVSG